MADQRKQWNNRQKTLRVLLEKGNAGSDALNLFTRQHAAVHTSNVYEDTEWSYADELFSGLRNSTFRFSPGNTAFSIACHLWHLGRIEDMTMNVLIADDDQVFDSGQWGKRMGIPVTDSGNSWDQERVEHVSENLKYEELLAYRDAVGIRTRNLVSNIEPEILSEKVSPSHINRLRELGAVAPDAEGLLSYWAARTLAGLLLMPPTRHAMVHLNQCMQIKAKLQKPLS